MKTWIIVGCLVLAAECSWATPIETQQSGSSAIMIGGVTQVESSDSKIDGFVSVSALSGTTDTPEARTAARSGLHEMAVNARIDDKFLFSFTDFSEIISAATYSIRVAPDTAFVDQAVVDFVLPASFLEVTNFAELPNNALETVILADLRVCFATACGSTDSRFSLQAILGASFNTFSVSVSATGDPSLDLTPLENPTVTDTGGPGIDFTRTTTVEFPFFQGHLELGPVPSGTPLTLEYQMQARASGIAVANVGLAAINDPFLLSTDPVQPGDPLTLTLGSISAVPAPPAWLLCLAGVAVLLRSARRRRDPGRR